MAQAPTKANKAKSNGKQRPGTHLYSDKLQRRPQRPISTFTEPFFSTLNHIVALIAIVAAIAITTVAVLTIWRPEILDTVLPIGSDYRANIVVESLFFWIEIAAIIIGLRLLERYQQSAHRRKSLVTIANALVRLDEEVYDLRVKFAADLDTHADAIGAYKGADFNTMPLGFVFLRNSFMSYLLTQRQFGVVEGKVFNRALRTLDRCAQETRRISEDCSKLSQKISAGDATAMEAERAQLRAGIEKLLDYEADIYLKRLFDLRAEVDMLRQPQKRNVFA